MPYQPANVVPYGGQVEMLVIKPPKVPMKGLAITSLILGVLSLVITSYGFFFGILGLVFSIVARKCGNRQKISLIGMILSIVSLGIWVLVILILGGISIGMGFSEPVYDAFINFTTIF
jgi:hypothetical protein